MNYRQRQAEARTRARLGTIFSPAAGMISHASDGRAYTRTADGSIRRVPTRDADPDWKRRARLFRDHLASIRRRPKAA